MKELEELTADIREKLPRLKALGDFCKIRIHHEKDPILTIIGFNPLENTYYAQCEEGRLAYVKTEYTYGSYNTYELNEVIGIDPMLNDVLECLKVSHLEYVLTPFGFHVGSEKGYESVIKWDLSKPYLKDQSPELIKFLHGLIKK